MITETAPGKVILTGEWGVLESDCSCIVFPTPCVVKVEIIPQANFEIDLVSIHLPILKAEFVYKQFNWLQIDEEFIEKSEFVRKACEVALQFLFENQIIIQPFFLKTYGFDFSFDQKVGLGSSSAVVIAIIKVIFKLHKFPFTSELLYKLGVIAHFYVQKKVGSGFDIAASAYEKPLYYRRFDPKWLEQEITRKKALNELFSSPWPNLLCQEIQKSKEAIVLVGWTGEPSSTTELIKIFKEFKQNNSERWNQILSKINKTVEQVKESIEVNNLAFLQLIQQNHQILLELNEFLPIYTEKLKFLVRIAEQSYFAGKLSGAGGGDCGIAVGFNRENIELIKRQWKQAGIEFLFEL